MQHNNQNEDSFSLDGEKGITMTRPFEERTSKNATARFRQAYDDNFLEDEGELSQELVEILNAAKRRLGTNSENELCRYIPHPGEESQPSAGYIHHFTMRRLKYQQPKELIDLVEKYVLEPQNPISLAPKQRAARGSRKKSDHVSLSRADLDRMLMMARSLGDKEMVKKLTPKRNLREIKKELIESVRIGKAESDLWEAYVEALGQENSHSQASN